MGIATEVTDSLQRIGLGTMGTKNYKLYLDLVRQFLDTVWVYYAKVAAKNAQ